MGNALGNETRGEDPEGQLLPVSWGRSWADEVIIWQACQSLTPWQDAGKMSLDFKKGESSRFVLNRKSVPQQESVINVEVRQ